MDTMARTTEVQSPFLRFNVFGICESCGRASFVSDVRVGPADDEVQPMCLHCWKAARVLARKQKCSTCGEERVCLRTWDGWVCADCLVAHVPDERRGPCELCGKTKVLRQTSRGWLCMLCQIVHVDEGDGDGR